MNQDMRSAIEVLRRAGRFIRIRGEVNPKFELPAVMAQCSQDPMVWFERVKGYDVPVVGNLVNRTNFSITAGIENGIDHSLRYISRGLESPIAPVLKENAPCREVVHTSNLNVMRLLPITTFFEKEAGPYISAGIVIAKDPETGKRNVSCNRLLVLGPDRLMIGMSPSHHLHQLLTKANEMGERLEVSIAIGSHPTVLVAANAYVDLGVDEFEIAGGMFGAPLELSPGVTVDVEAPAGTEFVIEAEFIPDEWYEEGLVSEFHGMYVNYGKSPVLRVKAITHRRNPIYQVILPGRFPEHFLIGALAIETTLYQHIKRAVPGTRGVMVTEGGMGRCHCVVSLRNPRPGEGHKAMFAAFAHCNLIKQVTVVNDDINIDDPIDVEWAIATRMRAERDLVVIPGVRTDRAEPLVKDGVVSKLGIIALKEENAMPKAEIPKSVMNMVRENWDRYQVHQEHDPN